MTAAISGGNVTAIFGGVELDFRGADIEGEEAVIYVEAVFGGIEIVVPERWNVAFEVQSVFAGYSDEDSTTPAGCGSGAVHKRPSCFMDARLSAALPSRTE